MFKSGHKGLFINTKRNKIENLAVGLIVKHDGYAAPWRLSPLYATLPHHIRKLIYFSVSISNYKEIR